MTDARGVDAVRRSLAGTAPASAGAEAGGPEAARPTGSQTSKSLRPDRAGGGERDRWGMYNAFARHRQRDLSPMARCIWFYLFSCVRRERTPPVAVESIAQVAEAIGASIASAKRGVQQLVRQGFLVRLYRGRKNQGPTAYLVRLPERASQRLTGALLTNVSTAHPCAVPTAHRCAVPKTRGATALPAGAVGRRLNDEERTRVVSRGEVPP